MNNSEVGSFKGFYEDSFRPPVGVTHVEYSTYSVLGLGRLI